MEMGGSSKDMERSHSIGSANTGPVRNSRYPLRMPERYGCALFGCSVHVPDIDSSYCCQSHGEMAALMDSAQGVPCIVFDGFKNVDIALCNSLLHRSVDGVAVGIPTIPRDIFSVPPWQFGTSFHPQLLPAEGSRNWVFFVKDAPEKYPLMGDTSYSWQRRSYIDIVLHEDTVTLVRNYLSAGTAATTQENNRYGMWGLLRYSHKGVDLFSLSYNATGSTIKRDEAIRKDKALKIKPGDLDSIVLKLRGLKRKRRERNQVQPSFLKNHELVEPSGTEPDVLDSILQTLRGLKRQRRERNQVQPSWGGQYFFKNHELVEPSSTESEPESDSDSEDEVEEFAARDFVETLLKEAVTENLELAKVYEIEDLKASTLNWFDMHRDAESDVLRAKVDEVVASLEAIKTKKSP